MLPHVFWSLGLLTSLLAATAETVPANGPNPAIKESRSAHLKAPELNHPHELTTPVNYHGLHKETLPPNEEEQRRLITLLYRPDYIRPEYLLDYRVAGLHGRPIKTLPWGPIVILLEPTKRQMLAVPPGFRDPRREREEDAEIKHFRELTERSKDYHRHAPLYPMTPVVRRLVVPHGLSPNHHRSRGHDARGPHDHYHDSRDHHERDHDIRDHHNRDEQEHDYPKHGLTLNHHRNHGHDARGVHDRDHDSRDHHERDHDIRDHHNRDEQEHNYPRYGLGQYGYSEHEIPNPVGHNPNLNLAKDYNKEKLPTRENMFRDQHYMAEHHGYRY